MTRLPAIKNYLTLFLVMVILLTRMGSVTQERFVTPIQSYICKTAYMVEDTAESKTPFFKSKRSSVEGLNLFPDDLLQIYIPPSVPLIPFTPFRALLEVYLEKFSPPDPR